MRETDQAARFEAFGLVPQPEAQLIFVVGCPRSGTTWVLGIMESHEQVVLATPENLGQLDTSEHGSKESKLFIGKDFDNFHKALLASYPPALAKELAFALGGIALAKLARGSDAKVIVEKTPTHLWRAHEIAHFFPRSRFIHVLRDGRDTAVSLLEAHKGWGKDWAPGTLPEAAALWAKAVELAEAMESKLLCERWLTIRYEDLLLDPEGETVKMLAFAGLQVDQERAGEIVNANRGGAKAWFSGVFRKGVAGEWRERFSSEDRREFHRVAGEQLIAAGYEQDDAWIESGAER
jgi:protein-tyrosine sulfotransferase